MIADLLVEAALKTLKDDPWRPLNLGPMPGYMLGFSKRWRLRGAGLWHLACARTVREHLPEVKVLTFDTKLKAASQGEGMSVWRAGALLFGHDQGVPVV